MADPIPENFTAILNLQPPGPPSMKVEGVIDVNSGGWSASLVKAVPQGFVPEDLILDLALVPPTGNVIQVLSKVVATFEEKPAAHKYTTVTIRHGKKSFAINVREVH